MGLTKRPHTAVIVRLSFAAILCALILVPNPGTSRADYSRQKAEATDENNAAAMSYVAMPSGDAVITVTTTADDLTPNDGSVSLREAITASNAGNDLGDPDITAQSPGSFDVRVAEVIPGIAC